MASASAQEPALLTHDNVDGKTDAPAERMQQLLEKITTYRREDYVKNERLVGAHPLFLDATYTPSSEDKSQNQHRQLEKLDVPGYDRIVGILSEYAEESPEWCEWTSETLQEDLSLPITSPPPCRLVQVFMIGVHLSPFVLTCYDDTSKEEEVRQYANQTASALKWRLLEFCHLDFLLLPCIATKNFDLAALKEEIMNMLEDLSECFGGATHLDDDMFHTMKEATTALAGLTSLPCLLDADGTAEMRQEVMERQWRGLLSLLIETLSKQQQQIMDYVSIKTLSLRPSKDGEFKASVAVIEAVKRLSLRNTFRLQSSVFNEKLPRCLHLLNTEMNKRYDVCLHLSTCTDGESPQEVLALNTHDDSKLQRAVSVRCELQCKPCTKSQVRLPSHSILKLTAFPSTPSTSQEGTTSDNLHLLLKPLRSKVEVQAFLNGIREDFINKVNVLEPGGVADLLIERGVLIETDNESIGAGHHPTRKEQARRVWTILYGIRHEVLVHDVLPVLCKRHSHIIPESFWISDHSPHDSPAGSRRGSGASVGVEGGGCTRCEIRRRLRPFTLADFLLKAGVMSCDVYSDLTRHLRITPPDYVWNTIFREFTKLSAVDAQRLQLDMTSLLSRHSLRVPDDIVDLMTEGFLCCCSLRSGTATRSMLFHLETLSLRRPSHDSTASDTSSSKAYPSSETDVIISYKSADSESLLSEVSHAPSRDLCDVAMSTLHPNSSSVPEATSSCNRGLSNLCRFLGELGGLFLSGGAATGKMVPRSKREQLKMNQTWHGRIKASELKAVSSECWTGYGSIENLKNTIAVIRESLVFQVLRELDNAKSLQEPQSLADIKSSISDKTAACVQSPSGNSAVKISSDSQSQSQSVKVTTKTEADSHSVLQSGITETETNSDSYSVSQSDSTDVKTRTDSQSVSQPLMIETESKMDSQLTSPTPHKGDPAADRSTHASDISNPSKRQIAAPTPVQLKLSSTFTTKSASAEQSSPRSSSGSGAVSSKESSVKLSSAKRQADVPSSLPLESSSAIATEDLCVVQSSPQSPAGSSVSSEGSSVKLSSPQSLASPVSLFFSASSDDEKLKNFRKALTKGDYERHRSVLHGTAPFSGQEDDDVISANDVISPDDVMVDVFFDKEDGSTRQPDSSSGDLSSWFNRLLDASTSRDQRSTEGSHAGQDDFISQTVERVKKNRDLQEYRSIVASDVNSAEKLREKYSQAVITDDTAKEEIGQLLQAYTDMELLHSEMAEKLKTTTDRLRLDAEKQNSSPDTSESAVSSEISLLCSHIQDLCDDMLVSTRTFLLCAFHLNTQEQLTSQCTCTETEHVVHDVMVLLQLASLEAWQSVQRLDEMRDQLCVGGTSEEGPRLEEVISLVQTFLEMS